MTVTITDTILSTVFPIGFDLFASFLDLSLCVGRRKGEMQLSPILDGTPHLGSFLFKRQGFTESREPFWIELHLSPFGSTSF